ncbi:MAG: hypothetical protein INR69_11560 [Mucilaginibacter polytrichastri]|nr:hypothetical protein [Mucilaginibacter polytrichastri]
MLKIFRYAPVFTLIFLTACSSSPSGKGSSGESAANEKQPSFRSVFGIGYTEVKRVYPSGLSFNDYGYQLKPEWRMSFKSDTLANIYNPWQKKFRDYKVIFDHDSVFNIAWSWMRVKKVTRDSIVFQNLRVENKTVNLERSRMFMTLYANDYIKNTLHTTPEALQKPSRRDTLFIKKKIEESDRIPDSAFVAIDPVKLESKSSAVRITKRKAEKDKMVEGNELMNYVLPEFDIVINKAYKDFFYEFSVYVDKTGKLHFGQSLNALMADSEEAYLRSMKGITDVYLQNLLKITPGTTLGMPHTSTILLHVKGVKKSG